MKEILTIQEAATMLGVTSQTLRAWDKENKLKPIRTLGKHRRYKLEEIQKLLNA